MDSNGIFQKMFIKPGMKFLVVDLPPELEAVYHTIPDGVQLFTRPEVDMDLIQIFVKNEKELRARLDEFPVFLKKPGGILWISYPKGSSKVETDINRDSIWPIATQHQLAPNRQIALDEVWSALRFKQTGGSS